MEVAHRIPKYTTRIENELQHMLHCVRKNNIVEKINSNSAMIYSHRAIEWENKKDAKQEEQKQSSKRGKKKVLGTRHKRAKKE